MSSSPQGYRGLGVLAHVGPSQLKGWVHCSGSDGLWGAVFPSKDHRGCEDLELGHHLLAS